MNQFVPRPDYNFHKVDILFRIGLVNLNLGQHNYSKQANGGYSLPCILFAKEHRSSGGACPGVLVLIKALELLKGHIEKKLTATRADEYICVTKGKQQNIRCQLDKATKEIVTKNQVLVLLCGWQSFPLRGHHDSGMDIDCFWALLNIELMLVHIFG